jgi:hypothetical protein
MVNKEGAYAQDSRFWKSNLTQRAWEPERWLCLYGQGTEVRGNLWVTEPALRSQWGERRKEVQREGEKGRWEEGERERGGEGERGRGSAQGLCALLQNMKCQQAHQPHIPSRKHRCLVSSLDVVLAIMSPQLPSPCKTHQGKGSHCLLWKQPSSLHCWKNTCPCFARCLASLGPLTKFPQSCALDSFHKRFGKPSWISGLTHTSNLWAGFVLRSRLSFRDLPPSQAVAVVQDEKVQELAAVIGACTCRPWAWEEAPCGCSVCKCLWVWIWFPLRNPEILHSLFWAWICWKESKLFSHFLYSEQVGITPLPSKKEDFFSKPWKHTQCIWVWWLLVPQGDLDKWCLQRVSGHHGQAFSH